MPSLKVNHNGSWVPVKTPHVFHNGAWVVPKAVKVFKDGQWVTSWTAVAPKEYLLDTTFTINHAQKNGIDYHGWARDVDGIDSPAPASLDFKGGGQLRTLESFVQGGIRAFNFQIDGISGAAGSVGIRKPLLITMESEGESISFATVTENAQVGSNEVHWFSQLGGFAEPHVYRVVKFFKDHAGKSTTLKISELDIDPDALLDTRFTLHDSQTWQGIGWKVNNEVFPNLPDVAALKGGGYISELCIDSGQNGFTLSLQKSSVITESTILEVILKCGEDTLSFTTTSNFIFNQLGSSWGGHSYSLRGITPEDYVSIEKFFNDNKNREAHLVIKIKTP